MAKGILVRYGGHLSRITNREEEWIESESDVTIDLLLEKISGKYPGLSGSRDPLNPYLFLITVNGEFIPSSSLADLVMKDGDVVHLFPPVSGG